MKKSLILTAMLVSCASLPAQSTLPPAPGPHVLSELRQPGSMPQQQTPPSAGPVTADNTAQPSLTLAPLVRLLERLREPIEPAHLPAEALG